MFRKILRKTSARQWFLLSLAAFFLVVTIGILIYWQNIKALEKAEILTTQQRSLVLARAGSVAISDFLKERKVDLLILSQNEEITGISDKEDIRRQLERVVDNLADTPVSSLVLVDKDGQTQLVVNVERDTSGEGSSRSDRDYFIWAKNPQSRGKFFIGGPVFPRGGPHQNELVFTLTKPIYYKDQFNGVLTFGFLISKFTERYVLSLRVYEETSAFITTGEGVLIGGGDKELLGKNLLEYAQEKKWPGWENYTAFLAKGFEEEGMGEWVFDEPGRGGPTRRIGAFIPVKIDGTNISLFVTTPVGASAQEPFGAFSQNQTFTPLVFVFALLAVIFWLISFHLAKRDGFLDGYGQGLEKSFKDWVKKAQKPL